LPTEEVDEEVQISELVPPGSAVSVSKELSGTNLVARRAKDVDTRMANPGPALDALQAKAFNFVIDLRQAWLKDDQWLNDVFDEAKKLFVRRPETVDEEAEEEVDEADNPGPVLLPQTPRVKSARAQRMQQKTK